MVRREGRQEENDVSTQKKKEVVILIEKNYKRYTLDCTKSSSQMRLIIKNLSLIVEKLGLRSEELRLRV